MPLEALLTPKGRVELTQLDDENAFALDEARAGRIMRAFEGGAGAGILSLALVELKASLPPGLAFFRELGRALLTDACRREGLESDEAVRALAPRDDEIEALLSRPPAMMGSEYLSGEALRALWRETAHALADELGAAGLTLPAFLEAKGGAWHTVGRVCFHLAENKGDDEHPFAFLATYTHRLGKNAKAQHLPLGRALDEYAAQRDKEKLLALLAPVHRAAEESAFLKALVDEGEVFHPLRLSAAEAYRFLKDAPALEDAGVVVRLPEAWSKRRPPRPRVTVSVGETPPARLGLDALLSFRVDVSLDGEKLTRREVERVLAETDGLAFVKGRWIEVDREQLRLALERWQALGDDELTLAEGMRVLAGLGAARDDDEGGAAALAEWSEVVAGKWLAGRLDELRAPGAERALEERAGIEARLRPYQRAGLKWLWTLHQLGLGGCLADDMGLGKTVQVLALLSLSKREGAKRPSLLVVPASLLANWEGELARFAPSLRTLVAHPSRIPTRELAAMTSDDAAAYDVVITSYGTLPRVRWLSAVAWGVLVVDEAQAIKNPGARQSKAVKQLVAEQRLALTGTPVENRLGDLWSIFDFVSPGLLGSASTFKKLTKRMAEGEAGGYEPLRRLVKPYLLRRLKTDRSVIADLPDKTEVIAHCLLSKKQATLYQATVDELAARLEKSTGMERRGLVLAFLMRMKQLCNHPSQWLGDGEYTLEESGKLVRLLELVEPIAARQEKALVFTQFREMTEPLARHLEGAFSRPGLILHGGTPVKQRPKLVERFQGDERVPFMVLTVKAGGTGLNLTAASHVIHFDRWWNPAVEDQATDRAFRIGQKKNVLVHKLVCRGTVEERIAALLDDKKRLAAEVLEGGAELSLTELDDEQLLALVKLDLGAALAEG